MAQPNTGKLVLVQSSFSSGELSPLLQGRTTLAQYKNGASNIENMVVMPYGGLTKRPGTKYIQEVKTSANTTIILPFITGAEQSYVLEFGNQYIRFYRNGGILLSTAAITNGTFASDLSGWTDDDTGTGASTFNSGTMRLNGGGAGIAARTQAVSYVGTSQYTLSFTVATNTCTYRIGTTAGGTEITSGTGSVGSNNITFTPSTAGTIYIQFRNANNNNSDIDNVSLDTPIYQLDSPYTSSQIEQIKYQGSKDVMYLCHPSVRTRKLRRFGASQWDIVAVDFVDGPYYDKSDSRYGGVGTTYTMTPSGTTGSVTLTTSGNVFSSTDVGRAVRYRSNTTSEWAELTITAYTSPTQVTATVEKTLSGTLASNQWRLGLFSETTGYPSVVALHGQRLYLGNTTDRPLTLCASKAGDIEVFQPDNDTYKDEVDDTTAFTFTVSSEGKGGILWLASRTSLYLGTDKAIFIAKASSLDEALTSTNIDIKPSVQTACHGARPINTNNATLFIQYNQQKVMELAYNIQQDGNVTADLTLLSEHLGANQFKQLVRQETPYNIIWAIDEIGQLFGLTYLRDQEVVGWHTHTIGGTNAEVKSICTIPGDVEDELWLIVSRTINGSTKQYVEQLAPFFRSYSDEEEDQLFLDSFLTYSGVATSTLTGLNHLEGETVDALCNGYRGVVDDVVTSGSISLSQNTTLAHVGLPYNSSITTLPLEASTDFGNLVGSLSRVWKAFLRVYRSAIFTVGHKAGETDIVENFTDNYIMGGAVPLKTEIIEIPMNGFPDLQQFIHISQSSPFNLTILTLGAKLVIEDER
ncbi:MAG: hypothetical protein C0446_08325 [Chitinophaga sp.]|nr:hypothetical protein [Chitinophaga sp.]